MQRVRQGRGVVTGMSGGEVAYARRGFDSHPILPSLTSGVNRLVSGSPVLFYALRYI